MCVVHTIRAPEGCLDGSEGSPPKCIFLVATFPGFPCLGSVWEVVGPVVADPLAQDNDKTNIYPEIP